MENKECKITIGSNVEVKGSKPAAQGIAPHKLMENYCTL